MSGPVAVGAHDPLRPAPLVLVTRPAGDADPLAGILRERGYSVAAVPTVATEPAPAGGPLDAAATALAGYDWVVATSATGVRAVAAAWRRVSGARPLPDGPPGWAAVGPATALALEAEGVAAVAVPHEARAAAIADVLAAAGPLAARRILLPRADLAAADLPTILRAAGAEVDEVVAYRTVEGPPASRDKLVRALDDPDLAAVVVASGSAVRGLLGIAAGADRRARLEATGLVSIGPSTSAVARELGLHVAAEAAAPTPAAIADALDLVLGTGRAALSISETRQ